jgi:hypothetical protein
MNLEENSDKDEVKLLCEGNVCEVAWHPLRKAA